ncbi:MAG: cation transporting ATPase C-terminal domain-containing protein, partial [Candidatus Nanohaloarchaea archaeon]
FVNYLLSANAGEVLLVFFGILVGSMLFPETFNTSAKALILTPMMLLWVNFVTDGLPALALGTDPKSDGIMDRPPRGSGESVINTRMMASIIGIGLIMAATGLPLFFYNVMKGDLVMAQTALFTFLVLIEMVRIQIIRQRYDLPISSNRWLIVAIAFSIVLQGAVLYTPMHGFFDVVPLPMHLWQEMAAAFTAFLALNLGMSRLYDHVFGDDAHGP